MMARDEILKLAPGQCPVCGAVGSMSGFDDETMRAGSGEFSTKVERLSGTRCAVCSEIFLDPASAAQFAAAGDEMVMQRRAFDGRELRRVRTKLGLSQDQAAALTGGGHNAFSRYEQGSAQPVAAVRHLFGILDRHPALLKEIQLGESRRPRGVAKSVPHPDSGVQAKSVRASKTPKSGPVTPTGRVAGTRPAAKR